MMKNKKLLMTNGTGFIATNFITGSEIITYDNLSYNLLNDLNL